jgi:ribosomal protein L11 methyltransferase
MSRVSLRVHPAANRAAALAALFEGGVDSVQEDGADLLTYVVSPDLADALTARVRDADPGAAIETAVVQDADWSHRWRQSLVARPVGRLTITPPWLAHQFDPRTSVVIEPGMAFGTGDHATTRGVVQLMDGVVHAGARVADLGTGSGVLAIAAAKLGASRVVGIEFDPDAIPNAEVNVRSNGVHDVVSIIEGDAGTLLPFIAPLDLVTANIISSVLLNLLPTIRASLAADGTAILSGIMLSERSAFLEALVASAWRVDREVSEDEWWSVAISPR